MAEDITVFVGIDAAKLKHAVAVAEPGRNGEGRYPAVALRVPAESQICVPLVRADAC